MKLRFCIAKVRTRNHCNIYVCIGSGSSVSRAGWQISYAVIARGRDGVVPGYVGVATSFPCQSRFFRHLSGKVEV